MVVIPGKTEIEGLEIEWIDHSSVKIRNDLVIYIDVFEDSIEGKGLEKGDLFFSTHDHYDHFDADAINKLARPDSTAIIFEDSDESELDLDFREVSDNSELNVRNVEIKTVPAYNKDKDYHPEGKGVGYILDFEGVKIYYSGDTDFIPEMKEIEEDIDLAFIPIGGTYTMGLGGAVKTALTVRPDVIIPTHYNFIDGTEADPKLFKRRVEEQSDIEVRIL